MIDKYYKILNANESYSDSEIEERYRELKEKYSEDRFLEGEAGNEAARKLNEVENAYREIMNYRREQNDSDKKGDLYIEVENAIKANDLQTAQTKLDQFNERDAEWHYLQSVVFYKKTWINESKKQLEIAKQMDPNNTKYQDAYNKIEENIKNTSSQNKGWNQSGNVNQGAGGETQQLGGNSCLEWCCQMAICNLMLNCCCNCH